MSNTDLLQQAFDALKSAIQTTEFENHAYRPWHAEAKEVIAAIEATKAQPSPAVELPVVEEDLYFLQDKRSFVGNCVMWWAKDGNGYTTRIDNAHRYTKDEAFRQHKHRDTDIPWPCSVVLPLTRPTIDMQDLYLAAAQGAKS